MEKKEIINWLDEKIDKTKDSIYKSNMYVKEIQKEMIMFDELREKLIKINSIWTKK